jgi:hypothetical protein
VALVVPVAVAVVAEVAQGAVVDVPPAEHSFRINPKAEPPVPIKHGDRRFK